MDELREALELASEEELQQLTQILFCRRLNPIDYLRMPDVLEVQSRDRASWLDSLEGRFRFLAADGLTVLKGRSQDIPYRQILIGVCQYLKIGYSQEMSALDLEAEIFLHLMGKIWKRLPASEKKHLSDRVQKSLAHADLARPLPLKLQNDPVTVLLKGSSVIAVNSVLKSLILQQIARQFALHFARYQAARAALVQGGAIAATKLQHHLALQTAKRGMAVAAARQGAVKTIFAFLGPVLWATFFADLGWRAIATNYSRIIPTIFALAQIRLTRSPCWA
ncbi:MAG: YaaW family protein [Spirulina sp.]